MAVWFAQNTANINSANMWNSIPAGGGSVLTWPPASGDVLVANGKTVTVNVSTDLGATGQVRNDNTGGATDGGWFILANGVTLTANVYAGASANGCVRLASNAVVTIVGNNTGGTASNAYGIQVSTGTATITGNAYGGTATGCHGVYCTAGTLNFTGNAYGNATGAAAGIQLAGTLTACTITGDAYGGGFTNAFGVALSSGTPTIDMTGNAYGGTVAPGVINAVATQTFNLTGNAIAGTGSVAYGVTNTAATGGTVNISGYAQASNTCAAVNTSALGITQVGETRSASNGRGAVIGAFRFASTTAAKSLPMIAGSQRTLSVLDVAALVPAEADVSQGVTYGDGAYTGTLPLQRKRPSMAGRF